MIETPVIRRPRESTWLWLYKIIAGVLIVFLLGIHLIVNHMIAASGLLSYGEVVSYYKIPFVVGMEVIFLMLVVSHALVGLRSILLDLNPSDKLLKITDALMWLLGIVSTVYGVWLAWVIANR